MLFKVAASTHATVRIEGSGRTDEHVVSDKEKQALSVVLGAYHSLGGKVSLGSSCRGCATETAHDDTGGLHLWRPYAASVPRAKRPSGMTQRLLEGDASDRLS